jgi:pSer/pThr/pTyr-binding forkhead associated (FHA) protein
LPKIIIKLNNKVVREIELNKLSFMIGRDTDSDIVIDDILVSRHHAKIFLANHSYYIEDLNSGNGVQVNKKKVTEQRLQDQDEILIGKHTLTFIHKNLFSVEAYDENESDIGEKTFVLPINRPEIMALQTRQKPPVKTSDPALKGYIVVGSGRRSGKPIELTNSTTLGGKSEAADIRVRGLFVGEKAFTINKRKEGFFITHVEGKRMTRVNGSVVIGHRKLQDGDLITIGSTKMKFSSKIE